MHLPSCATSLLGPGYPKLADCSSHEESLRGNLPLAELNAKPQDKVMNEVQWCVFAGLRAYPCSQIRNLCVGLREENILLHRPEVLFILTIGHFVTRLVLLLSCIPPNATLDFIFFV